MNNKQAIVDSILYNCKKLNINKDSAFSATFCPPTTITSEKLQRDYLEQKLRILNEMDIQYICVYDWQKTYWHLHLIFHSKYEAKWKNLMFVNYIEPTKNFMGYVNYLANKIVFLGNKYLIINYINEVVLNSPIEKKQISPVNSQIDNIPKAISKKQAIQKKHNTLIKKISSFFNYTSISSLFFYQKKIKFFNDS